MEEVWKPVVGYEGYYEVSNYGRVRSLEKQVFCGKGYRKRKGTILKAHKSFGYLRLQLSKDGVKKKEVVHRLVAMAFIPNPNNYPFINHKDECRDNNRVDNLEWCTPFYNSNYGTHPQRMSDMFLNYPKYSLPVQQIDLNGKIIGEFPSIAEATRKTGIYNIERCCKGESRYSTAGGYVWRYK